jgi:PTH1 family peptidyl-tRNA hydrolase
MHLVVGLGNPGAKYARTRHNVGFDVVERLAEQWGISFAEKRFKAKAGKGAIRNQPARLVMPQTFMNLSGSAVGPMAGYFKVPVERIVVVHDELDLPFGAVKVKEGGGHGGHNGLRDLSKKLPSKDFVRVRVGVGRPPGRMEPADFVLAKWKPAEAKVLPDIVDRAAECVESVLADGVTEAMNRHNGEPPLVG